LPIVLIILYFTNWYLFKNLIGKVERIFIPAIITAIGFNLVIALNFYPNLLKYQASSQVGKIVSENKIPDDMFYYYNDPSFSLDFYAQRITPKITLDSIKNIKPKSLIFINKKGLSELEENQISFKVIQQLPSYKVTALKLSFLNKHTRNQTLEDKFLIEKQ
jgi:hypothetical protein